MILTIDINRANTICTILIMNENSQRTMYSDKFSGRRPQRPEPREIIESNWHPIIPRTDLKRWSWGRIHSEGSPHMDLRSRLSLNDKQLFHTSKNMMSSCSGTVGRRQHTSASSYRGLMPTGGRLRISSRHPAGGSPDKFRKWKFIKHDPSHQFFQVRSCLLGSRTKSMNCF